MDEQKKHYANICDNAKIPIFSQPWWLDITAGEKNWAVEVLEEDGKYQAALPYVKGRTGPFSVIRMPRLTPWLHIWFHREEDQSNQDRLGFEKKTLTRMIKQLPDVMRFYQKYSNDFKNWMPFYWQGYQQTTRYSYIIDPMENLEHNLNSNTRYKIRRAGKRVRVENSTDVMHFLELNRKSFRRQNKKASYQDSLVLKIDEACATRECRKILIACDDQNNTHAAVYLIEDDDSVYYMMGGMDPAYRSSFANYLLIWEAIQYAVRSGKQFDFEGSMIESIENFFRLFNPRQQPYFVIKKAKFPLKLIDGIV